VALIKRLFFEPSGECKAAPYIGAPPLLCTDLEATIRFYVEVIGMRLTRIVQNRNDPTSTHIFFDMGGGNQLAFFDLPEKGPAPTVRGVCAATSKCCSVSEPSRQNI
jgi:catechol 2,3-dioxygenase-like lactoylglutathione lyase family enzyme